MGQLGLQRNVTFKRMLRAQSRPKPSWRGDLGYGEIEKEA